MFSRNRGKTIHHVAEDPSGVAVSIEEFRKHGVPIEKILYGRKRYVASASERGEAFIIEKTHGSNHGIAKCNVLQGEVELSREQVTTMSELVMNPESYWIGMPRFRRFPPKFTFAVRLYRDDQYLDVLMDVGRNAGWAFFHSKGYYHNYLFNWIGTETKKLRGELFPFSLKRTVKNLLLGNNNNSD